MDVIFSRLDDLVTCLQAELESAPTPDMCFVGIVPGDSVALEYQGDCTDVCGMAWVRVVTMYPSSGVGIANTHPRNCDAGLGIDVEIGTMRCITPGDENGAPPSAEELRAATELQVADMLTVLRAIRCCQGSDDWIVGQYQPYGPQGGVFGSTVQVNFLEA